MLRPLVWGTEPLGWCRLVLITHHGTVRDSHHLFLEVRDPWGILPCAGGEGLSPWMLWAGKKRTPSLLVGTFLPQGWPCRLCVLSGKSPVPGLEGFGVQCSRTFIAKGTWCLWLWLAVLGSGGYVQHPAPRRPPGLTWYGPLLSLVPFRWVALLSS
jgi:hypothetical protein